jgi:hypothetical protein
LRRLNEKAPNDFGGSMARMVSVLRREGAARLFKQWIVKCLRQRRHVARGRRFLAQQKFTLSGITMHRLAIQLHRHAFENVFRTRVKGTERGHQRRQFDFSRSRFAAFGGGVLGFQT